jgi:hypothetical protein
MAHESMAFSAGMLVASSGLVLGDDVTATSYQPTVVDVRGIL